MQRVRDWWLWLGEDDLRLLLVFSWGVAFGGLAALSVVVGTMAGAS